MPYPSPDSRDVDAGAAPDDIVVIGAGPAGLTAAYQLAKAGVTTTVVEADDIVGGISRSPERDGWRFDIGGHRFFTKVAGVEALWHEILPDELMTRPRMSRIYYRGRFYDYPIRPLNALRNLGVVEAVRALFSYLWIRVRPPKDQSTLEGYIVANYGWRLYNHFFKTYNEKVWGVSARELSADWGAQRIKGMSLWSAVWEPIRARVVGARRRGDQVTSLIEQFEYPELGPGMMWERCAELIEAAGTEIVMESPVTAITRDDSGVVSVTTAGADGETIRRAGAVISSMALPHVVQAMDPPAPAPVLAAAAALRYRDFLTVALVVPEADGFPDNWIYVHSPDVKVGRIQNFGSWSPHLVHEHQTCLGLEYFVNVDDELWAADDDELIILATKELAVLGLVEPDRVTHGYVVRMPRAYPVYDEEYQDNVDVIRAWLAEAAPNLHPVGRNGMHKYNNQDHSMLTAMLTVENLLGADHDIWAVNVDDEYHESGKAAGGRDAPVLPRQ